MATSFKLFSFALLAMGGTAVLSPQAAVAATNSTLLEHTQQDNVCKGIVKEATGEPLIGATVVVDGTKNLAVTDFDGNFTLSNVKKGDVLIITYLGFEPYQVKWNGQPLDIVMKSDSHSLEELVVVGYGVQKKSSLTGSVASVSSKDIVKQTSSNVASTLQGRTPGVEIIQQAGVAGADVNIVIRGAASFGATEPLYIIDGAFSNNGLTTLNPNDIESIEILKDGAAAAIYGSRAANGVVIITTKRGKQGKPLVELDGSFAVQTPTNVPDFLNASQWRQFANTVADNSGLAHAPENDNPTNPNTDTDWADEWLQFAPMWNLNASISGGGENSTFSTSVGYLDQKGMTIYSGYKRYNFRVNSSYKKGIFSLSENLSISHRDKTPTTPFSISLPTLPIYDEMGRLVSGGPDYYINPEDGKAVNKIAPLAYSDRYSRTTDVIGAINAQLDRFIMKITMGYPSVDEEVDILSRHNAHTSFARLDDVKPAITKDQLLELRGMMDNVVVDHSLLRYIAQIVAQSRESKMVYMGCSPRASVDMLRCAKAYALLQGRDFVIPDDIKTVAPPVMQHRLMLTAETEMEGYSPVVVAQKLIDMVEVPK